MQKSQNKQNNWEKKWQSCKSLLYFKCYYKVIAMETM